MRNRSFHTIRELVNICAELGVSRAEWHGFAYNRRNVLYRHGRPEDARPDGYIYPDCPIINLRYGEHLEKLQGMDFVLLEASRPAGRDLYVIPAADARDLATKYPQQSVRLVKNSRRKSRAREITEALEIYRKTSIQEVKAALR